MRAENNSSTPPFFDEASARERLWRPHIGMSVQYIRGAHPQLIAAAIVTRVHSPTSVNLCVFADGLPLEHVTQVPRRSIETQAGDCWDVA